MDGFSYFQSVAALLAAALWVIPLWRILERTGHQGAWALLAIFPPVAFITLWLVAFGRWPAVDAERASA